MATQAQTEAPSEARLGHETLMAYNRAMTQWCSKGALHEDAGTLLAGNGAFRAQDAVTPTAVLDEADAFFARRKRGYSVKVRNSGEDDDLAQACEERGLAAFGDPVPQMICRQRLEVGTVPEGITLRAVHDEQGIADFATVNTDAYAAYGMPAEVFVDLFDRPGRLVADTDATVVVAYQGTQPVATAMTYCSGGVACLQWVGTLAAAGRRGLGRVVTEWATNMAFDRGATSVTLQASAMGEPLYARLGYTTQYHYREYVRWSATA
jgi:GNAT superfamily N-acetyltransferase